MFNLLAVWRNNRDDPEWSASPLFRNPMLTKALIVKHRLRRNELDLFNDGRQVATKVLLPIDSTDLRFGGRYIFVDQIGFERSMEDEFGSNGVEEDKRILRLLDQLPSLDPFLMREQLRRYGVEPARCYFELTEADMQRMFAFAQQEIMPLVTMSVGEGKAASSAAASLVSKILSNVVGEEMEPLRLTLRLELNEYAEGVFCWKGFLYYKWCVSTLLEDVRRVMAEVGTIAASGPIDEESQAYLGRSRKVLRRRILSACDCVTGTLAVYDDAYENLTRNGRPNAFREFLLDAPLLFTRLGEQLGAIQHIVTFWRFRFPSGARSAPIDELMDMFMDFETSLMSGEERQMANAA